MSFKIGTSNENIAGKEPIEVFCRLRPTENENEAICLKPLSDTTLLLTPLDKFLPWRSGSYKQMQYTFKEIFDETVSQDEVFEKTAFSLIKDLVFGFNGLFFTYGIVSSGKTYTITGTPERCGLIPRCLDTIFNTIGSYQAVKFVFKPDKSNSFDIQSKSEVLEQRSELQLHTMTPRPKKKEIHVDWKKRVNCQRKVDLVNKGQKYAVFVSYVEIYNNYIYDLLQDPSVDPVKQNQPQSKLLREDASRNMYVFGATEVEVKNWEEAFDLFCKGQQRRRVCPTALNIESNRSHMVFTIRLVQASLDSVGDGLVSGKARVNVSQLSLVDLAGSERMVRTKSKGTTMQETCNINSSLMVFRSCIESLRESQHQGQPQIIPYRESKLTHLFKSFFEGEGKIKILICVNPSVKYYEENIYMMKFAEVSQEILIPRVTPVVGALKDIPQREMESHFGDLSLENLSGLFASTNLLSLLKNDEFDETILNSFIEVIEDKNIKRVTMCRELKCFQEKFRNNLVTSEKEILTLKQENAFLTMDLEARLKQVKCFEKKQLMNEDTIRELEKKVQVLERTVKELEGKLKERDATLEKCEEYKDALDTRMQQKLIMERKKLIRTTKKCYKDKIANALKESRIAKTKVQLMKGVLESNDMINSESEVQEPYENLHMSDDQLSTVNTGSRSVITEEETLRPNPQRDIRSKSTLQSFKTSFTNLRKDFTGRRSYVKSLKRNFSASTSNLRQTPTEPSTSRDDINAAKSDKSEVKSRTAESKTSITDNQGFKSCSSECTLAYTAVVPDKEFGKNIFWRIPVINPRHCRFRPSKEFWVEHKPPGNLELGTVFQPRMQRKKSVSKLEITDIVKNAQKYVLTHQEEDSEGEMETHLFKGDVIPSSCGGARVIFKDVEKLKQVSPTLELGLRKKGTDHAELGDVQEKCAFSYECRGKRPETPKRH